MPIPKESSKASVFAVNLKPVELPKMLIQIDNRVVEALLDAGGQKLFLSAAANQPCQIEKKIKRGNFEIKRGSDNKHLAQVITLVQLTGLTVKL